MQETRNLNIESGGVQNFGLEETKSSNQQNLTRLICLILFISSYLETGFLFSSSSFVFGFFFFPVSQQSVGNLFNFVYPHFSPKQI